MSQSRFLCIPSIIGLIVMCGAPAYANWPFLGVHSFVLGGGGPTNTTLNPSYSSNSPGHGTAGPPTIAYLGVGFYRVDFPGAAILNGGEFAGDGHVQATSWFDGNAGDRCKVSGWGAGADGTTLSVWVRCFTTRGAPVNTVFAMNFIHRDDEPGSESAYVWARNPSASSYTLSTDPFSGSGYAWNSTGGNIQISHTPGTGTYSVTMVGQYSGDFFPNPNGCSDVPTTGGTVEVTAYGTTNTYCKVVNWSTGYDTTVNVACFDGSTGAAAESNFDVLYSRQSPTGEPNSGYAWASNPTANSYTPNALYTRDMTLTTNDLGCPHFVAPPTVITHGSTGSYAVQFPIGTSVTNAQNPQYAKVTGYGSGSDTCQLEGIATFPSGNGAATNVYVQCFSAGGAPVNANFTVSYAYQSAITGIY